MSELEQRLIRRTRVAYAHAVARRAEAIEAEASQRVRQRLDRAERHGRRSYLEALRLADMADA